MIPYEDINVHDARMYWDGCTVFKYSVDDGTVCPYHMEIEYERNEEEEDYGDAPFEEHQVWLTALGDEATGADEWVSGRRLFKAPEYIMHRFNVEYIPILYGEYATGVVRVCVEPLDRFAQKGMSLHNITHLPLVEVTDARIAIGPYQGMGLECVLLPHQAPSMSGRHTIVHGIAHVLRVGTPQCMRRNITSEQASANAHALVKELFTTGAQVAVPDFSLCVIKHRTRSDFGFVMYRGNMIGTVDYAGGELYFHGSVNWGSDSMEAEKKGKHSVVSRLITNHINWKL